MTTFMAHCNECDEDFEYSPFQKNSTVKDGSDPWPLCPKCKKTNTTIVKKIPTNEDEAKKSRFEKFKEGTEDLEQRRLSY